MASLPYGAMEQDTGEFMLGKVAVTPVFLESDGTLDASTENWTPTQIQSTLQTIQTGLNWWVELLARQQTVHPLEFVYDTTYAITPSPTKYEPISRPSNDYAFWGEEFLTRVGYSASTQLDVNMRAFNNAQRQKLGTDWAFTIFVVNSNNDADGLFAPSGSFSRAFGFAGGLFFVCPSTRPASTFAHETGHQFWARDEYLGGASFGDRRGYYNTQNVNAADNSTPGFVQQPSIMATGTLLQTAYDTYTSPASTLAMIGWQDSDRDGIFDVLDVPLELSGSGYYDAASGSYKFRGLAKAGTLPNQNSEGLRNDVTLNRISQIQYRTSSTAAWITFSQPNLPEVALDLSIALPASTQTIEIRAIDTRSTVTSNVFQGRIARADSIVTSGVNGYVWIDANKNGVREPQEFGEAGWNVELLSASGQSLGVRKSIEPDTFADGTLASSSTPGATITAYGSDADGRVGVFTDTPTSTGNKLFRGYSKASQSFSANWNTTSRRMRVDFASTTGVFEIDAIGAASDAYGRLEAYDMVGNLLARVTSDKLAAGQVTTLRVQSATNNIAYVLVGGHANTSVRLDNLKYGAATTTTTTARGGYAFPNVPSGSYLVKVTPPAANIAPVSSGGNQVAAAVALPTITNDVDLGFRVNSSNWQNSSNRLDVNGDGRIAPLDVLLIINDINQNGARALAQSGLQPPPYVDVNGDGNVSALDALLVINFINASGSGEGESDPPDARLSTLARPAVMRASQDAVATAAPGGVVRPPEVVVDEALDYLLAFGPIIPKRWLELDDRVFPQPTGNFSARRVSND